MPDHTRAHLRLVPPPPAAPPPDLNLFGLVDAAVSEICRRCGVTRPAAVGSLLTVSRLASRPVRDVATGALLAHRLPLSLVTRLRRPVPRRPPGLALAAPAHVTTRHPSAGPR